MYKINFNTPLMILNSVVVVGPDNQPLQLHKELAFKLHTLQTANALKNESICLRIYEKGEVELDQVDFDFLKKNIDSCQMPDYMKTSALRQLDEAKAEKEKKENSKKQ